MISLDGPAIGVIGRSPTPRGVLCFEIGGDKWEFLACGNQRFMAPLCRIVQVDPAARFVDDMNASLGVSVEARSQGGELCDPNLWPWVGIRSDPAQGHHAMIVPGRVDPVVFAWIFRCYD